MDMADASSLHMNLVCGQESRDPSAWSVLNYTQQQALSFGLKMTQEPSAPDQPPQPFPRIGPLAFSSREVAAAETASPVQ